LGKFQDSLNQVWVIEIAPFKLGYSWKHLGKLKEVHSDLHVS